MSEALNLLEGYIDPEGSLLVTNPADNSVVAQLRDWSVSDAEQAVEAAHKALPAWAAKAGKERSKILRRWYDLIEQNRKKLAAIVTAECGKPLSEALGEVIYGAPFIEWFAEEAKRVYIWFMLVPFTMCGETCNLACNMKVASEEYSLFVANECAYGKLLYRHNY